MASEVRDDRIFPLTKVVAALIVAVLLGAFAILYLAPTETERLFAWTIKTAMMPMLMGGGYLAGAYFFVRVILGHEWHRVGAGFLPVTVFASTMLAATLLHLDRFNHGHINFYIWTIIYLITPFLVPLIWWRNRVADPLVMAPDDIEVPQTLRRTMGVMGVILIALGIFLFLLPETAMDIWPWALTPLTARVLAGWMALSGALGIAVAVERRWSAVRIPIQTGAIGAGLTLIAMVRGWSDWNQANPLTWIVGVGFVAAVVGLVAVDFVMEARRKQAALPLPAKA